MFAINVLSHFTHRHTLRSINNSPFYLNPFTAHCIPEGLQIKKSKHMTSLCMKSAKVSGPRLCRRKSFRKKNGLRLCPNSYLSDLCFIPVVLD